MTSTVITYQSCFWVLWLIQIGLQFDAGRNCFVQYLGVLLLGFKRYLFIIELPPEKIVVCMGIKRSAKFDQNALRFLFSSLNLATQLVEVFSQYGLIKGTKLQLAIILCKKLELILSLFQTSIMRLLATNCAVQQCSYFFDYAEKPQ